MPPDEFRDAAHQVADLAADYLDRLEGYDVLPQHRAGRDAREAPRSPAENSRAARRRSSTDYRTIVEPYITHWQHPMFMAYFPSVASGPGILGRVARRRR